MDERTIRRRVEALFPSARRRAGTRVGLEHELLAADASTGDHVSVERVRSATTGAAYAGHLGFEPGGQVELSLPPAASADELSERLVAELAALRRDCGAAGIRLLAKPVDPRSDAEVPLQLTSPRYLAMQRHFDTIGHAGRTMMRRTASTQVCLDWWSGCAGLEQWRVLQLAGPFLAAAFSRRGAGPSRLATWLGVDPSRTAFDDRLLRGEDPVLAYVDFARAATVFTAPTDVDEHLTTLFPPVRPRGRYLEVRFPDAQPEDAVVGLVTVLATLAYDDGVRSLALRRLAWERDRLEEEWHGAANASEDVAAIGHELVALAGVRVLDGAA